MTPLDPPVSVLLALWAPVPSSYGLTVVQGRGGPHAVGDAASPAGTGPVPLGAWLTALGRLQRCLAVLVSPADPLPGLAAALDAGQGVLLETAGNAPGPRRVLLVPEENGASTLWHAHELASPAPPLDAGHARREIHAATQEAIEALTELDLARGRPELADELTDLITANLDPRLLPPSLEPRRRTLLERSLRLGAICDLALSDDGAAASAAQAANRARVLRPLAAVARRGVAAATQWWA
ncbi:hypothetical protein [Actinomyces oricola]